MKPDLAEREALIATAEPGIASARALSTIADEAVRELSRAASVHPRGRWALVALGGWGAGALLPKSDLDLLVLADARSEDHKPFIEAILYPLWDAGLKVGHQTRTPREQSRAMREDSVTMTAALTARPIAGDCAWASAVLNDCVATVAKRRPRALARLAERERPGSPFLLELDLKESRGGRRDYDELVWSAAIVSGVAGRDPRALVTCGALAEHEFLAVTEAAETLARARWVLQRAGLGDVMTLEGAELLNDAEAVQRALATTALTLDRARRGLAGHPAGSESSLAAADVFALLDAGIPALPALEEAAASGRLDQLLPQSSALMTTRRPGLGHQLTVGAHCLRTAALLKGFEQDEGPLGRSRQSLLRPRALQVAALVHDVGKLEGGAAHPERGAPTAQTAARSFGLDAAEAAEVADLVRLHLELAETALRNDIDDEDVILRAAARVGHRDLVAPLHLLTAADSMATGPATWNQWVAALIAALAARLDAALSDEVDGAGLVARGEAVRAATLASIPSEAAVVRSFAESAPLRYLASREPAEVASQARLLAELENMPADERIAIAVGRGPAPGIESVTVAAPDRPELFARIAGALALAGLDILAADAYSAPHGLALDTFAVTSATLRAVDTSTWQAFDRYLRASLRDRLELETRLAERRHHYGSGAAVPVTVETDASAGYHTIVRVTAPDRTGLLYDIARAVWESGLDIRWARAITVEGMALDTFHVTGPDGAAVTDPGILGHLAMRLRDIG